ncbi:MarR family winged helix-turn-helix transcriptional regulator [Vibrio sp. HN007]|uniref:MarR family winged helix-turn-helix transcriptional regulator n=1 Tax=Vibrio iocasae TaxID=3098914 RepID=UPI0035D525B8
MSNSDQIIDIENQICFSLYSASNAVLRAYRPLLDELDLTYLQYMTMIVLWKHAPLNVKEIGKKMHLDSGTLTPLLKRLEQKELISRNRSSKDERVMEISLTEKGESLKDDAVSVPEKLSCKINIAREEALELKRISDSLLKNLVID